MQYKFEDIAINSTAKKKPTEEDKDTYIGLEHLDSDCLYVTRWGADAAPTGEKLLMKKGDVLFGKRRAYQRKVGIAPFDGIFSAHGMVLRPNEEIIDKNFFPFFISSDQFMERAVRISVGGLSPTINWKDLRVQEFTLPSIEDQQILADKLWAAYRLKESYKKLLTATQEMVKSQFIEMFGQSTFTIEMQECFSMMRNGANIKQGQVEGGFPITRIETISDETIDREKMGYAGIIDNKYESYYLQDGDILVSHINSLKHIGKCALYSKQEDEIIIHGMNLLCLRPIREIVVPAFAIHMLRSDIIKKQIADITKPAVNQASFSVKDFGRIKAIIPDLDEQNKFVAIAEQADKSEYYN